MTVVQCACGARYRVETQAAGKRFRCRKCGQTFASPEAPAPCPADVDDLLALSEGAAVQRAHGPTVVVRTAGATADPAAPASDADQSAAHVGLLEKVTGDLGGYLRSVAWTFLFPSRLGNLATLAAFWFLLAILPIVLAFTCFGWVLMLLVQAAYMAYCLSVVVDAAAGEEDLGPPTFHGDWLDELIWPALRFAGTWVIVRLPALLWVVSALAQQSPDWALVVPGLLSAALLGNYEWIGEQLDAGQMAVAAVLYLLGHFFWPMLLLVVAVGGDLASLVRLDLMGRTILRTLPAYTCVVGLVFASLAIPAVIEALAAGNAAADGLQGVFAALGISCLSVALEIYVTFVAMRVIGLYYHHFKERFTWSWE